MLSDKFRQHGIQVHATVIINDRGGRPEYVQKECVMQDLARSLAETIIHHPDVFTTERIDTRTNKVVDTPFMASDATRYHGECYIMTRKQLDNLIEDIYRDLGRGAPVSFFSITDG